MSTPSRRRAAISTVALCFLSCGGRSPASPVATFSLSIAPDPVEFRRLFPVSASSRLFASPPPPDPRYYAAITTVTVGEHSSVGGTLDSIRTYLVPRGGSPVQIGSFDSNCTNEFEFNPGASHRIPPGGQLTWCVARIATPDPSVEQAIRFEVAVRDDGGNSQVLRHELPVILS